MSEFHGGPPDTPEERLQYLREQESLRQDIAARKRHSEQGFFKRLVTTPDDYREPDEPVGGSRYMGRF